MYNADVRQYLREIKKGIPCTGKRKRDILSKISETIGGYLEENPDARYEDLTARFGIPKQIVSSYVEEMDTPELIKKLHIKKKIVGIIAAAAVAVVVLWAGVVAAAYISNQNSANGYFEEEIYGVVYSEQDEGGD